MKRLMIDMDDVICGGGFLKLVNTFLNTSYTPEDIPSYYIQQMIPEEKQEEWKQFFSKKNVYDYVTLLPEAKQVIEQLNKKYEVYIITDFIYPECPHYAGENLRNKFYYLYENLPFLTPKQFVFGAVKDFVHAEIKIDDIIRHLENASEKKILFTAYHNKNITLETLDNQGITRVNNWKEIEAILL